MAMFGKLNTTHLQNEEGEKFNRGSFDFRPNRWSVDEMVGIMRDIAERSVLYYFSKYREEHFSSTAQSHREPVAQASCLHRNRGLGRLEACATSHLALYS